MASARHKVVKVENLDVGAVHFGKSTILGSDNTTPEQSKYVRTAPAYLEQEGTDILAFSDRGSSVDGSENGNQELEDVVYPLPSGWPKIPQLFEVRSWNFSTAVSPTVNKAVGHLELLQTIIEEWFREASRPSSISSKMKTPTPVTRKQLRFSSDIPKSRSISMQSRQSSTQALSIHGVGTSGGKGSSSAVESGELPYLGADEVIEEVVTLLAKLETDRQETLDKLASERDRVQRLGQKIDELAIQRMYDLPSAVQKEHEACALNIAELNWHVNYRSRIEERLQTRVSVAASLNKKLTEDVEFVHGHVPLVKEKLDLEQDAMKRIENAQEETNEELQITQDRLANVNAKSLDAHAKADEERKSMKMDLDGVSNDLTKISEELDEVKKQHITYIAACNDCRQRLKNDEQELKVLEVREENAKVTEALQAAKVKALEGEIVQAEYEHGRLASYNDKVETEKNTKYAANKKLREKMEKEIASKTEELRQLTRQNKELDMDIEDAEIKIKACDKQKIADDKNIARMLKEQARTENLTEVTADDLAQVTIINNAVRDQLMNEEDRCVLAEEQLKSTAEALKKQVKDEMHNRTVLAARISSESSESEQFEIEAKEKTVKASKKVHEVEQAVKAVTEKVERFRASHEEKTKALSSLTEEYEKLQADLAEMEKSTVEEKERIIPQHEKTKTEVTDLEKRLDHIEWKSEMMGKKMEDMSSSSAMIQKSFKNTNRQIENLQELLDELAVQIETNKKLDEDTISAIDDVTARSNQRMKAHRDLLKERKQVHATQEEDLEAYMQTNEDSAHKYRRLQNQYVAVKNSLLNKYDDKVKNENAIKDLRQLQSLQKRMQAAMLEYYKYRGLYNQGELSRMEKDSNKNGVRVGFLKEEMDKCLEKIATFLKEQFDGDFIRKTSMEKVAREEAAIKNQNQNQNQPIAV